ncbi:Uncharacterized protein DBV15_08158 [Temnothorax longispinosus]|uniref:Uncharacterized protein n=1 Tax=Temnothorax longispinosus TaxID=300112 RepID=A0A4S2KEC3_9HYME|nr:Uncharacterized protein DBV15_08158 [Temnothorax longispinosus]
MLMGAYCFFPIVSLPGIVLTTDSQLPAHQLTLSTALGCPCSKFEVESCVRDLPAFEECNGLPSKGRTTEKKNMNEKEESGVGEWDESKTKVEDNRLVELIEHHHGEDEGCATSRTRFRLIYYLVVSPDEMRLPKKTKWVRKKNEKAKGWQTCFGRLRGKGVLDQLENRRAPPHGPTKGEERERKIEKEKRHEKGDRAPAPQGPGPTLITTPPDFLVIIWWFQYRDRISSGIPTLTFHRDNHTHPSLICANVIDDVAYSASWVKRKKRLGGDGGGSGIREGKEVQGERESRLGRFLGSLRGPTRGFKGVLDVDVAEARKARQLGSAAGCQNLCPLPPPHPNQTTTYTHRLPSSLLLLLRRAAPPRRAHLRR